MRMRCHGTHVNSHVVLLASSCTLSSSVAHPRTDLHSPLPFRAFGKGPRSQLNQTFLDWRPPGVQIPEG